MNHAAHSIILITINNSCELGSPVPAACLCLCALQFVSHIPWSSCIKQCISGHQQTSCYANDPSRMCTMEFCVVETLTFTCKLMRYCRHAAHSCQRRATLYVLYTHKLHNCICMHCSDFRATSCWLQLT